MLFDWQWSIHVNDLLSVNQVTCCLNLVKGSFQVLVPRIEFLVGELTMFVDGDDACETIDLGCNSAIDHHVAQLVLSSLNWDTNELAHASKINFAVIFLDHAQIVLHKLPD